MGRTLTAQDAVDSLAAHVAAKGAEICAKFGPNLGWGALQQLLNDRAFVRYPCEIRFESEPLQAGEFAFPEPKGPAPEDGFTMYVHPIYLLNRERVPALILYQLVAVNYGEFAAAGDAEIFGAAALGMPRDNYYAMLCEMADVLSSELTDLAQPHACGCGT